MLENAEILARLGTIERHLARLSTSDAERRLLIEIAIATERRAFTVAELLQHVDLVPSLRASLIVAVGTKQIAKRIGKLLARHRAVGAATGVTVERLRYERGSALWVCYVKAAQPIGATSESADDLLSIRTDTTQAWNPDSAT